MIRYRGQTLPEPQIASDIPRLFPELAAVIGAFRQNDGPGMRSGPLSFWEQTPAATRRKSTGKLTVRERMRKSVQHQDQGILKPTKPACL